MLRPNVLAASLIGLSGLGAALLGVGALMAKPERTPMTPAPAPSNTFFAGRCLSMGGLEHEPHEGAWAGGRAIQRSDFAVMRSGGFDTVRLGMNFDRNVADSAPYRLNEAYFRRVDEVIGWALASGLNVIIAPLNQVSVHEDPARGGPKLIATWAQLSARWAGLPGNVAFAPLNEPNTNLDGPKANALYAQLIATIRPRHPDRWLLISPTHWGSVRGLQELALPPSDPRLIVDVHYYAPYEFTHSGADWIAPERRPPAGRPWPQRGELAQLSRDIDTITRWSAAAGLPVFVGEYGVDNAQSLAMREAWSRDVTRALDSANLRSCYYSFAPSFSMWDHQRETWIAPIYQAVTGAAPPAQKMAGLRGRS
jgi:endoglucanase